MSSLKTIISLFFLLSIIYNLVAATVIQPKVDEISLDSLPEAGDVWEMELDPAASSNVDPSAEISTEADADSSESSTNILHNSIQVIGPKVQLGEVQDQLYRYHWTKPLYINKYHYHWGTHIHYDRKIFLHQIYKDNKFYKICYADDCRFTVTKVIR
ncbi:23125_t:CDS:1 [Dentiscutata erythropus]|uniref:23125_t:CDS:1 n=1 Tax=Dentiscutata erythropus TaxID=1348616 RepID=A0A9N8VB95_9GLOM|nr:23125_t:CDS:1 [Dentiscutata erythropus]